MDMQARPPTQLSVQTQDSNASSIDTRRGDQTTEKDASEVDATSLNETNSIGTGTSSLPFRPVKFDSRSPHTETDLFSCLHSPIDICPPSLRDSGNYCEQWEALALEFREFYGDYRESRGYADMSYKRFETPGPYFGRVYGMSIGFKRISSGGNFVSLIFIMQVNGRLNTLDPNMEMQHHLIKLNQLAAGPNSTLTDGDGLTVEQMTNNVQSGLSTSGEIYLTQDRSAGWWRRHHRSYLPRDGMYMFYGLIDLTAAAELEQSSMEPSPDQMKPDENPDGGQQEEDEGWLGDEPWEDL
jgi:hypothetical protein